MSLTNVTVKATYPGNASTTEFAIPFDPIVDDSAETLVYIRDEGEDPVTETLQTEGAGNDYTLTGAVSADDFNDTVTFNSAPAADQKVIIIRQLPLTQLLALTNSNFNAANVNQALDRLVAMIQQLDEELSRCVKLSITEQEGEITFPDPVADKLVKFNSAGDDLEVTSFTGTDVENAEGYSTAAVDAQNAAEAAQAAAEAAQAAAEAAANQDWSAWVEHSVNDGQAATNLNDETVDGAVYSSAWYHYEIIRGTSVVASGTLALHYKNSTWSDPLMGLEFGDASGVTFSQQQSSTSTQLKAALNSGAGNGTIKLSRRLIPA